MRLLYNEYSPFARKVRVVALVCRAELALVQVNPHVDEWIREHNPLCKIPALVLDDGGTIFDSRVIVEYIVAATGNPTVLPAASRMACLRQQALGDGICDAAVALRGDLLRPKHEQSATHQERQRRAIAAGIRAAERTDLALTQIGTISLACALGYLDVRHSDMDWRSISPVLGQWHKSFAALVPWASTAPPDQTPEPAVMLE